MLVRDLSYHVSIPTMPVERAIGKTFPKVEELHRFLGLFFLMLYI